MENDNAGDGKEESNLKGGEDLKDKKDENHDPWQVCCGHHLVNMLSFSNKSCYIFY